MNRLGPESQMNNFVVSVDANKNTASVMHRFIPSRKLLIPCIYCLSPAVKANKTIAADSILMLITGRHLAHLVLMN